LAPLIILLAILLLAGLLTLISWRNYQHEEHLRQRFLTQQGATLIRSLEAGARTGMMMRWRTDALKTLVEETVRETEVAYIAIVDQQGVVQAAGGSWAEELMLPLAKALESQSPLMRVSRDALGEEVFEVSRQYRPRWAGRRHQHEMADKMRHPAEAALPAFESSIPQAIFVGLYAREFEQARRDSLQQNLLLGGLLLLVGTAGFYLLLLSQRNRATRSTLETMELYAERLIEGMPAGLLSLDATQHVLAVNSQTLEMLGRTKQDVLGRSIHVLQGDPRLSARIGRGDFIEQPFSWQGADGKLLPLRISASALKEPSGELLGTVLILRDMREQQAMEEQLERSRRHSALGIMATGVAHEIRNPLGTLRGFAQYFQRSTEDEKAREYAGLMISEVDRLNRVISALLQFSRPQEIELTAFNCQRLCERVRALMADEVAAKGVTFVIDSAAAPETFTGDFDLLLQLLLNLLQNALEASQSGGTIRLKIDDQADRVELSVKDNGCGIGPETLGSIFDPFYTTRKSGTGLGLAIVSQIVEQHAGSIKVVSSSEGGSEFIIRLPQQAQA